MTRSACACYKCEWPGHENDTENSRPCDSIPQPAGKHKLAPRGLEGWLVLEASLSR